MNHKIPQAVLLAASNEAFNEITYIGNLDGQEVYGFAEVDESGFPVPLGLPTLGLWDGKRVEIVSGEEGLQLLGRFE